MTKIVINRCFGGFSLSHEAVMRYAELKGVTLYPERDRFGDYTYYTLPPEKRVPEIDWTTATRDERIAYNEACDGQTIYDRDIPRDDATLVQVVEELGKKANGRCAALSVVEIPDGVSWGIEEYDGNEHIAEAHRTWS